MSRSWPNRIDARFNRIVQCRDSTAQEQVEQRLNKKNC